jgi:hypothetical protein
MGELPHATGERPKIISNRPKKNGDIVISKKNLIFVAPIYRMMKTFAAFLFLWWLPCAAAAQFSDNFEAGMSGEWLQLPANRWAATDAGALAGDSSLKHVFDNTAAATDIVYRPLGNVQVNGGITAWRFVLRHNYNPSNSNKWGVVLFADTIADEWKSGGSWQGYVIGVNQGSSSNDDTLSLYAVRNNTFSNIKRTRINWEKDVTTSGAAAVEVTRSNEGEWTVGVAVDGDFDRLESVAQPVLHSAYSDARYMGVMYAYTAAADRQLWVDDVSLGFTPVAPPAPAAFGDVVINEIMAKAEPSAGLPEVPYIELYNRAGRALRLDGWKIEFNNTVGNIAAAVVPDSAYLILCTASMVETMSAYGAAAAATNMSSLTKSGKTLTLKNNAGTIIARTTYSDAWMADDAKRGGGWALEKKDVNNLSETAQNWAASTAGAGGTPGGENSVRADNADVDMPFVVSWQLLDESRLQLVFNEFISLEKAAAPAAYWVNNGIGIPAEVTVDESDFLQVTLRFAKSFATGTLYELRLQPPFSDLAGNPPDGQAYVFGKLFTPAKDEVVINEALFNPFSNGADFVEIYNRSDKIFDVRQFRLATRDKQGGVAGSVGHDAPLYLNPRDYVVFSTGLEVVQDFYSVPFPDRVVALKSLPAYSDAEGCIVLLNETDDVVDELLYSEKMHSGFIVNPEGISLERVNPATPAAERANWQSAAQDAGWATPTARNSQFNDSESSAHGDFSLRYRTFSPDGDGYQDVLFIDYNLPDAQYEVSITIYDVQGRVVRELGRNVLLGASGALTWDGTRDNSQRALSGLFIVFIKAYNLNGNVKTYKLPCAVTLR